MEFLGHLEWRSAIGKENRFNAYMKTRILKFLCVCVNKNALHLMLKVYNQDC
jgi:hypothetical protein